MYRLITPLDGSHFAEAAVETSARLAERLDATLDLVHVVGSVTPDEPAPVRSTDDAERYLTEVANRYAKRIQIQQHVLQGHPVDELLRFFGAAEDAVVVMSRFGRSGLHRSRSGGVADSLVHRTGIPILLIDSSNPDGFHDLNEILVPLDGSDIANLALPFAINIAGDLGRLCLIRVVQPPDEHVRTLATQPSSFHDHETPHEFAIAAVDDARDFLFRTANDLRRKGTTVSWEIRFGEPGNEILRASETAGADLIVIATHGWGGVRRWSFGSISDVVIHGSTTPVLVIPPSNSLISQHSRSDDGEPEAR